MPRFHQPTITQAGLIGIIIVCIVSAIAVAPGMAVAQDDDDDIPPVPASYFGTVIIDGDPAPAGTEVTAVLEGEEYGPLETDENGEFGGKPANKAKLTVGPNSTPDDPTVTFLIDGEDATETVEWESGASEELQLTIETDDGNSAGVGGGGGGGDGESDSNSSGDSDGDDGDSNGGDGASSDSGDSGETDGSADTEPDDESENESSTGTDETNPGSETADGEDDGETATATDEDTTGDGIPGFGVLAALSAIVIALLGVQRRRT